MKDKEDSNTLSILMSLIKSDLHRYGGRSGLGAFLRELTFGIGFRYTFWMRICGYLRMKSLLWLPLRIVVTFILRHYMYKFGIQIPASTLIGHGLYIGHFGDIVVSSSASIGRNCNINHGVTIGQSYRGRRQGAPTLGDNIYIGPGAKIFGRINIGNNVAIGANCVVTKDVPDNAVVVGVPGEVVSMNGSDGYITHTDYDMNNDLSIKVPTA